MVLAPKSGKFSFLQSSSETSSLSEIRARLRGITTDDLLNQIPTPTDRHAISAFMQGGSKSPDEILGVLKQMKIEFGKNLKDMQGTESSSATEFEALKAAKSSEIAAGEKLIKEKTAQLGRTKVALAEAAEDREDTEAALEADRAFLVDLKERCANSDAEWETRSKTRAKEMQAVSEAIGILTDEDAHDLFHKSLSFLQLSSTRRVVTKAQRAREAASRILLRQGQKTGNKALVQVAASARLDGFKAVTDDIEGMISDLKAESADEIKHKDYCNDEFHKNEMETLEVEDTIKDLTTMINDDASTMGTLKGEIAALQAEIADTQLNVQRANENRAKENKEFQSTVADQRATQVILKKALDRLKKFYEDGALVQLKSKRDHQEPGAAAPRVLGLQEQLRLGERHDDDRGHHHGREGDRDGRH